MKEFWKNSFLALVLKHFALALVILFVLAVLALWATDFYTRHGETETVPDVRGMSVAQAQESFAAHRLSLKIIDSLYVKEKRLGVVLEQTPAAGASTKPDRSVFVVINSQVIKQIPLPSILETSQRSAEATLRSIGMTVQRVEYIPSEFKNLVLAVKYQGQEVAAGTRIPDGGAVVLVVGQGIGTEELVVPQLRGMTLAQAQETILAAGFVGGATLYDKEPSDNESNYIVYRQRPSVGQTASQGTRIDIWLSTDRSLLEHNFEQEGGDEEFF